jgi:hypothetical protein
VNHLPTVSAGADRTFNFVSVLDTDTIFSADGSDPDMHELEYVWRDDDGRVVFNGQDFLPGSLPASQLSPGPHTFTVTASDGRGGTASDSMVLTIEPLEEIYLRTDGRPQGAWRSVEDATAADGFRLWHPDAGVPKLAKPLASPVSYLDESFPVDPSQTYKLWLRLKANTTSRERFRVRAVRRRDRRPREPCLSVGHDVGAHREPRGVQRLRPLGSGMGRRCVGREGSNERDRAQVSERRGQHSDPDA